MYIKMRSATKTEPVVSTLLKSVTSLLSPLFTLKSLIRGIRRNRIIQSVPPAHLWNLVLIDKRLIIVLLPSDVIQQFS